MKTLIVTSGISGAGKTTFLNKNFKNVPCVCPDDIRKEVTGDVSDQSKNPLVWKIAYDRLLSYLNEDGDGMVTFSATTTSLSGLKSILDVADSASDRIEVKLYCFSDSLDWELCQGRVKDDINNGVDRSRTFDVMVGDKPLIKVMSEKYSSFISLLQDRSFLKKYGNIVSFEVLEVSNGELK